MIHRLSPFYQRCLALGLLALALLSIDALLLGPWREQRAVLRQQIETDRATIERYRGALAKLDAEVKGIEELRTSPIATAFLGGAEGKLASTELQELVRGAADRERIALDSLQILPKTMADGIGRQGLSIAFDAPFPALVRMIHAIESATPLVRLTKLELQPTRDAAGLLAVGMTAEGLLPEDQP